MTESHWGDAAPTAEAPGGNAAPTAEAPGSNAAPTAEAPGGNAAPTAEAAGGGCRHWVGHVIVCGLQPVGLRAVGQLNLAGARVVVIDDEHVGERSAKTVRDWGVPIVDRGASLSDSLFDAGVAGAEAVICIEATDLRTLETILLVRDLRSDVRLVAHLDNPAVANAVEEISGAAAVLDVASLFAPAVVDACLGGRVHDIELGDVRFSTVEVVAPRASTLRKLYGNLVPLGVTSATDQNPCWMEVLKRERQGAAGGG